MANKALATRQKMRLRVEPSQQFGKPRNPIAALAKVEAPAKASYFGASVPATNAKEEEVEEPLLLPVVNWKDEK